MERTEISEIIRMLKQLYPKDNFVPEEWYAMYGSYDAKIIRQGIRNWYSNGDWGFRAPTPNDIRGVYVGQRTVGGYDPNGVFDKALQRIKERIRETNEIAEEANKEIRNG